MTLSPFEGAMLGLVAAVSWGLSNVLVALVTRRLDSLTTLAIWQLASVGTVVVLGATHFITMPAEPATILPAVLAGAVGATAYLLLFASMALGPLSVVSPLLSAQGAMTVVLSVLLLGEALSAVHALGVILATIGVAMTGIRFSEGWRRSRFIGPGVGMALLGVVAFGLFNVTSAAASRQLGWADAFASSRITTAALIWICLGIPALRRALGRWRRQKMRMGTTRLVAYATAGSVISVVGFVSFMVGVEGSLVWLVGMTSSFSLVVVIIAGLVLFDERPTPRQYLGIGLVFASLPLLAL